jgi:hypothetical protein
VIHLNTTHKGTESRVAGNWGGGGIGGVWELEECGNWGGGVTWKKCSLSSELLGSAALAVASNMANPLLYTLSIDFNGRTNLYSFLSSIQNISLLAINRQERIPGVYVLS